MKEVYKLAIKALEDEIFAADEAISKAQKHKAELVAKIREYKKAIRTPEQIAKDDWHEKYPAWGRDRNIGHWVNRTDADIKAELKRIKDEDDRAWMRETSHQ